MVHAIAPFILSLCVIACNMSAACSDSLLLSAVASVEQYDIDTTGHWWAITRPYAQFTQLVVDGVDYGTWDSVDVPVFAYDGSTWASRAVRSGQWVIVTPDGPQKQVLPIMRIMYPTQSTQLWWVERNGATYHITNGERSYTTGYPVQRISMDPQGMVVAWIEQRPGVEVLMRNGAEVARGTEMNLYGVWSDGRCVYTNTFGTQVSLLFDDVAIAEDLRKVFRVCLNPLSTIVAWQAADGIGQVHTYLYTDEYDHPWEGPVISEPDPQMALAPFDALVAYRTSRQGSRVMGYNAATYPLGLIASPPVFSHDGAVMAYTSKDNGDYVVINGKRTIVKAGVPTTDTIAVNPSGNTVAWCSSTTLVVVNIEFNRLMMGRMCDSMGRAIYDRRDDTYKALGIMGGRLYLLTCDAR